MTKFYVVKYEAISDKQVSDDQLYRYCQEHGRRVFRSMPFSDPLVAVNELANTESYCRFNDGHYDVACFAIEKEV